MFCPWENIFVKFHWKASNSSPLVIQSLYHYTWLKDTHTLYNKQFANICYIIKHINEHKISKLTYSGSFSLVWFPVSIQKFCHKQSLWSLSWDYQSTCDRQNNLAMKQLLFLSIVLFIIVFLSLDLVCCCYVVCMLCISDKLSDT